MKCPVCHSKMRCLRTKELVENNNVDTVVRRNYECKECYLRWITYELLEESYRKLILSSDMLNSEA